MKFPTILACVSAAAHATSIAPRDTQPISVPTAKPDGAPVVPKDFVGFGIESAFFPHFNNEFSANLVSALAARMSEPPILRVGGTSGDYFLFEPNQDEATVCYNGTCDSHQGRFLLGRSYFEAYSRFQDAKTIVQAPLGKPVNTSNTLAYVWNAWQHLGNGERVAAIALGNEVEFIYREGAEAYVAAALELQDSIVTNLSLSNDAARIFEAGNTASGTITKPELYHIPDILDAGINENGLIATTAEHWYQISGDDHPWTDEMMQSQMINHTAITDRFELYTPGLKASHDQGIEYAITEDSAVLGGAVIEFSGGFGYTLWAVDFNLVAMARGVSRVANLAGRPNAKRVFWAPDDTGEEASPGPQARAPFPAAIFVADFIGVEGASAVAEIETEGDITSAYAMYDEETGALQRVALLNLRLYNGTTDAERGEETFEVSVGEVESVKVRRLHADKGVAAMGYDFGGPGSNVSWAGEQWSYDIDLGTGHFLGDGVEEDTVEVEGGVVSVAVPDSEVVMLLVG